MRATSKEMSPVFKPASLDEAQPNKINSPTTLRHEKGGGRGREEVRGKGGEAGRSLR